MNDCDCPRGRGADFAARAKVRRGCEEIRIGFAALAAKFPAAKSPAMIAAADERSAASRCWASSTKTRLLLPGGLRAGDAVHGDGAVSEEMAAELLGEIAQGLLHGSSIVAFPGRVLYNVG